MVGLGWQITTTFFPAVFGNPFIFRRPFPDGTNACLNTTKLGKLLDAFIEVGNIFEARIEGKDLKS
jgi:hypothetical protein